MSMAACCDQNRQSLKGIHTKITLELYPRLQAAAVDLVLTEQTTAGRANSLVLCWG